MEKRYLITEVKDGSIAQELGIEAGDALLSVNKKNIEDIFDYRFLITDEYIEIIVEKADGEQWLLEIEKEETEDLGIDFESGLMDNAKSCRNKCIFCFVDQLPPGMRETLYFKDDDTRLSFLQGNYVTLTNMSGEDIDRIIYYHLSPINISVHSTDLELRRFMLKNPNSNDIIKHINKLKDAGITMNFQIVLCKNINDGKNLDKTIDDLSKLIPSAASLSVVPVGITKYRRENRLFEMEPFDEDDCKKIIAQIHSKQAGLKKEYGTNFVFLADEFYIKAGIDIPEYKAYENFPQIENGVGMVSLMKKEFHEELESIEISISDRTISIATGKAAYNFIFELTKKLTNRVKGIKINVYSIENTFFGEQITVSGLLTGNDIINQLKGKELGDTLFIPENSLRSGESVFLDDVTTEDIEKYFNIDVIPIKNSGKDFINKIIYGRGKSEVAE